MTSRQNISSIWRSPPTNLPDRLNRCIRHALKGRSASNQVRVFFRADDIGVPGRGFDRLIRIFTHWDAPLALAVVPAWITPPRWSALMKSCAPSASLFCWHQHGWRHQNHEPRLKKQEFGPSRSGSAIALDLSRGRARLASVLKENFYPAFTPPWNRCSLETLDLLLQSRYRAVSRFAGARPSAPGGLPDIPVRVDLHTRRETRAAEGWKNLFAELENGLAEDRCGIMIHHRRMNATAFDFLACLLERLTAAEACRLTSLPALAERS